MFTSQDNENYIIPFHKLYKLNLLMVGLKTQVNKLQSNETNELSDVIELFDLLEEEFCKLIMCKLSIIQFPLKYELEMYLDENNLNMSNIEMFFEDIEIDLNLKITLYKLVTIFIKLLIDKNLDTLNSDNTKLIVKFTRFGNFNFEVSIKCNALKNQIEFSNELLELLKELNGTIKSSDTQKYVFKFPTSKLLINILKITSGQNNFGIPFVNIEDYFQASHDDIVQKDNFIFLKWGNNLIKLYFLDNIINNNISNNINLSANQNVVVLNSLDKKIGVIIDVFKGEEKIINRLLSSFFKSYDFLAGYHMLKSDELYWILNIPRLLEKA